MTMARQAIVIHKRPENVLVYVVQMKASCFVVLINNSFIVVPSTGKMSLPRFLSMDWRKLQKKSIADLIVNHILCCYPAQSIST